MEATGSPPRKILLVDDDPSLLATVGQFLRFEGYDVTCAESGEQALEVLKTLRPHLVILDMSMPGMGGVGFLQRITGPDGRPQFPVLVLTARAQMAEFFANLDVDGFIAKPAEPDDLLAEVGRILFLRGSEEPTPSGPLFDREPHPVLLGEPDAEAAEALLVVLEKAGFSATPVVSGAALLEQVVVRKPEALLARARLPDLPAETLVRLVRGMPSSSAVPIVVYGLDETDSAFSPDDLTLQVGSAQPDDVLAMLRQLF